MDRRAFIIGGATVLAAPLAADAQQAARVGFLVMARNPGVEEAFPRGLRDLGYVEGRDVVIEWRSADGRSDRLPALAAQLVQLGVAVVVAGGPETRDAAMKATSTIPIVVIGGVDPVAEGWAASLAHPGGNVTGLTVTHPEIGTKKLEFLKQMIPGLARVAVFQHRAVARTSSEPNAAIRTAARSLRVDIQIIDVQHPGDFEDAFRTAIGNRRQAGIVTETAMIFAHRVEMADLGRKYRLPIMGEWRPSAEIGFLGSYGADLGDLLRRSAIYVAKILRGARPADLPVERPTKFELVINLKTAKTLGLTIPRSLLSRADQIIE